MLLKRINTKNTLKYLSILFVCLIFANAKIGSLNPFLFAFYFALLFTGTDEKFSAVFTLASHVIVYPSLENFYISLTVVFVGVVYFYIHKLIKRKFNLLTLFFTYILSLSTYIYYNLNNFKNLIFYILLGLVCLFIFIVVMQILLIRKNCFKLTLDESICFLFAISIIGLGLHDLQIFNFSFFKFFIILLILICVAIGHSPLTYILTISISFGASIGFSSLTPVAEYIILAMLGSVFAMPQKFKISFMVLLGEILIQYFFLSTHTGLIYPLIPTLLAILCFLFIPNKYLNNLSDLVYVKNSELSSRNLINLTRKNIRKRMTNLSNTFLEMKNLHLNMLKKELTKEELNSVLLKEINLACCKNCIDKNRCSRSLGTNNKSNLEEVVTCAINKGKLTLLDIPVGLSNRCNNVNVLISTVNRLIQEYKHFNIVNNDMNNLKLLLADQMGAVSSLLLNLGDEIDTNVKFDIAKENKIISRLLAHNIQCKEVLLYNEKNNDLSAILIVKADSIYNPVIEKEVSSQLKTKMVIEKIVPIEDGNYCSVYFVKKSKFDCMFGLACCNKAGNEICGDCHSIIRLNNNKFLLALCDGMGSGTDAHKISAITLELIENFYKVGFDNDIILESVNKLLSVNNQENYSTLDVCLIDLEKQIADFIKVGAPFGLIKKDTNVEVIEGGALPIGALDNIKPSIYKTTISTKDIIILATDGIMDAFVEPNNLIEFVSKLACTNPQTIAETILAEALRLNEMSAKDDMTVLVARTYLK